MCQLDCNCGNSVVTCLVMSLFLLEEVIKNTYFIHTPQTIYISADVFSQQKFWKQKPVFLTTRYESHCSSMKTKVLI